MPTWTAVMLTVIAGALGPGCASSAAPAETPSAPVEQPSAAAEQPAAPEAHAPAPAAPSTVVEIPPASSAVAPAAEEPEPSPAAGGGSPRCPAQPNQTPAVRPERIKASHIQIAYLGAKRTRANVKRTRSEAKALAQQVLRKLCAGASFTDMAGQYSDEPGAAKRGGNLGRFRHSYMVKPFADAAFALQPGELSPVVETDFGFHVILRTE